MHTWATSWENLLFMPYANNIRADQPVHPPSLISTFVIHCLDSIKSIAGTSEIPRLVNSFISWAGWFESYLVSSPTIQVFSWFVSLTFDTLYSVHLTLTVYCWSAVCRSDQAPATSQFLFSALSSPAGGSLWADVNAGSGQSVGYDLMCWTSHAHTLVLDLSGETVRTKRMNVHWSLFNVVLEVTIRKPLQMQSENSVILDLTKKRLEKGPITLFCNSTKQKAKCCGWTEC